MDTLVVIFLQRPKCKGEFFLGGWRRLTFEMPRDIEITFFSVCETSEELGSEILPQPLKKSQTPKRKRTLETGTY